MVNRGTSVLTVLKRGFICSEDSSISAAARAQSDRSAIVTLSKQLRFPYETIGTRLLNDWQRQLPIQLQSTIKLTNQIHKRENMGGVLRCRIKVKPFARARARARVLKKIMWVQRIEGLQVNILTRFTLDTIYRQNKIQSNKRCFFWIQFRRNTRYTLKSKIR